MNNGITFSVFLRRGLIKKKKKRNAHESHISNILCSKWTYDHFYMIMTYIYPKFTASKPFYSFLLLHVQLCIIVECSGTISTRVARTLPFDMFPSRWTAMLRTLWTNGRFWEWPRNGVETFLRIIASPDTRKKMMFEFRPEDGPRASLDYQRRYGYRGQWLIELLGSGFHPDDVSYRQPLPPSVLVPPPPSF